mmetsp:Transcript_9840/g.17740  ORF Transcript_9840/g.17740 Transcript_9840/m.17740 type:complete len:80 (-) Transcript_9840:454-693(-)
MKGKCVLTRRAAEKLLNEREEKKTQIVKLKEQEKHREARYLRADLIGYKYREGDLDSDSHYQRCNRFDYSSDTSLVPPW